ncbi:hypothetical protein PG987_014376 [Apiospora arundinis]
MAGFQFSVELTKLVPMTLLGQGLDNVLSFARELKKSGSDLLVENDLVAIFGRGKVDERIKATFLNEIVHNVHISTLYPDSGMSLQAGPGPSVRHAIKSQDRSHLATVIQLSMLSWFHARSDLAACLSECIAKRFALNYPGAQADPGFEGIDSTLHSIAAQTSAYPWNRLAAQVEAKLRRAIPTYGIGQENHRDLTQLTPNLLFACMDMLYLAQSLPEDRRLLIRGSNGIVPLIIWAHEILSLKVHIQGLPGGGLRFGGDGPAQVLVIWAAELPPNQDMVVSLLDSSGEVLLKVDDSNQLELQRLGPEERHPLKDYGTQWLRRMLNLIVLADDSAVIYPDLVQHLTAVACLTSQQLKRPLDQDQQTFPIEPGQIMNAAKLVFRSIDINAKMVKALVDKAPTSGTLNDISKPRSLEMYLESLPEAKRSLGLVRLSLPSLVALLLVVACVPELQTCEDIPLVSNLDLISLDSFTGRLRKGVSIGNHDDRTGLEVEEGVFFTLAARLLVGYSYVDDAEDEDRGGYVVSDFGWSLLLDVLGDKDPGDVWPWKLHLRRGVPTLSTTQERKYRLRDMVDTYGVGNDVPSRAIYDRSGHFVPRCVTHVREQKEYFTARRDAFLSTLRLQVEERIEKGAIKMTRFGCKDGAIIELAMSYRELHRASWRVTYTTPCEHADGTLEGSPADGGAGAVKLSGEAAATNSLNWRTEGCEMEDHDEVPERVCILLVQGDKRSRWLAVREASMNEKRKVLLRTRNTCVSCAVDFAMNHNARWLVII